MAARGRLAAQPSYFLALRGLDIREVFGPYLKSPADNWSSFHRNDMNNVAVLSFTILVDAYITYHDRYVYQ